MAHFPCYYFLFNEFPTASNPSPHSKQLDPVTGSDTDNLVRPETCFCSDRKAILRHFLSNSLKSTKNMGGLQALY
jgi:hypothetical protein